MKKFSLFTGILIILILVLAYFAYSFIAQKNLSSSDVYISTVVIPPSVKLGEGVKITGTVKANIAGTYLVEFGLQESTFVPLSIIATRSACDTSTHYAGKFVTLSAGQTENFEFTVLDYGVEGSYNVVGGVYTKCFKDGGEVINEINKRINIYDGSGDTVISDGVTTTTVPSTTITVPSTITCEAKGHFTALDNRIGVDLLDNNPGGSVFLSTLSKGTFVSDSSCKRCFIIGAGIPESTFMPLAFLPVYGYRSACDGNIHYAEVNICLEPKESINFEFRPKHYGKEGSYWLQTYAFDKCAKDGGSSLINGKQTSLFVISGYIYGDDFMNALW